MQSNPVTSDTRIRIGAVSYLNSKPLVAGLESQFPEAHVRYDLPSRLADGLAGGDLNVALIPTVEYLRQPKLQRVSNACVACDGPVLSVKLYFRKPPSQVRTLALDEGSRTSAALAQVLLWKLHDVRPNLITLPIGSGPESVDTDAVLLIGDRAMYAQAQSYCDVWDLGDRWCRWTELPFVFAVWAAQPMPQTSFENLSAGLQSVRDAGVANVPAMVASESARLKLDETLVSDYLTRYLHFTLGPREQAGMDRFASLCDELNLLGADSRSLPFVTA